MKERPILFSGPMVRAILESRKTMTRRVITRKHLPHDENRPIHCRYGQPGDRLWVRETAIIAPKCWNDGTSCNVRDADGSPRMVQYLATNPDRDAANDYNLKATSSIFMPRWASRITLEITDVRVEHAWDISEEDAKAEGVQIDPVLAAALEPPDRVYSNFYRSGFQELWDSINKKTHPWASNPWVWCLMFKVK